MNAECSQFDAASSRLCCRTVPVSKSVIRDCRGDHNLTVGLWASGKLKFDHLMQRVEALPSPRHCFEQSTIVPVSTPPQPSFSFSASVANTSELNVRQAGPDDHARSIRSLASPSEGSPSLRAWKRMGLFVGLLPRGIFMVLACSTEQVRLL